ncbi:MAG TPA: protease modulator HflK N-terminal domain-containing protein, partial [Caldimonas sp.]
MTLPSQPDQPSSAGRLPGVAAAGRAWLAAALRRAVGRRPAAQPAGVTLLENGRNDGPPDLDELWRDFNRKLSGLFSGRGSRRGNGGGDSGGGPNFQPNLKSAGVGAALIGGVIVLIWLGSGVFIVQEGQQAVVTSFGRYSHTVDAGFQ